MNKWMYAKILFFCANIIFAQDNDFVITREFIDWQKNEFKNKKRTAYDLHYEKVNKVFNVTAHVSVLGKDTILTQKQVNSYFAKVTKLYEPTGFIFKVCKFNYVHGYEYDTISTYPPYENGEELKRKNYEPYTINMYFGMNLQGGDGTMIGGLAPLPTTAMNVEENKPPVPDERGANQAQKDWIFISTQNNLALWAIHLTMAHELGHYFGLLHPHEINIFGPEYVKDRSQCHETGDLMCDTPAEPNLHGLVREDCHYIGNDNLKIAQLDPAGDVYMPSVTNIMSYSRASCKSGFTEEQFQRMLKIYYSFRTYLR